MQIEMMMMDIVYLAAIAFAFISFQSWLGKKYPAPRHDLDKRIKDLEDRLNKTSQKLNTVSLKIGLGDGNERSRPF